MNDSCTLFETIYDTNDCYWRNETQYRSYYELKILGYLNLTFCVTLIISNILVIMVLSRKSVTSPMSTIFTHIAITESLTALSYIPRVWHEFFRVEECSISLHRTYAWEVVSLSSYRVAFIFRHVGVWLAVMLAVWRYIAIIHPLKERRWCDSGITRKFIVLGYIFGAIITIPHYFAYHIGSANKLLDNDGCLTSNNTIRNYTEIYEFQSSIENNPVFYIFAFFCYGIFLKLLPAVAFTFISFRLIIRLIEAKKQRESMISQQQDEHLDRRTIGLVLILILFIIGEVPQGIFCILTVCYGPAFYHRNYYYGFEIFNTITHLSESFNFIIYYAMSHTFRETFKTMISCKQTSSTN